MTMTYDEFTGLPVGSDITVHGRNWSKVGEGEWQSGPFKAKDSAFAHDLQAGTLTTGPRFAGGQLWDEGPGGYLYLLLMQDTGEHEGQYQGQWWAVQLQPRLNTNRLNGPVRFCQVTRIRNAENMLWSRVTEPPNWVGVVHNMGDAILAQRRDARTFTQQLQNLNTEMVELRQTRAQGSADYRGRLAEALHSWAEQHNLADDDALGDILEQFQMPRPAHQVTVTIDVYGLSNVPVANPSDLLPQGAELNGEARTAVPWKVTLSTVRSVEGGNCACEQVSRADVQNLLVDSGYDHEELDDFDMSCENCG